MRFIQHKAEAYWFYRVVSLGYDRWINPLFWTEPMRDAVSDFDKWHVIVDPMSGAPEIGKYRAIIKQLSPAPVTPTKKKK